MLMKKSVYLISTIVMLACSAVIVGCGEDEPEKPAQTRSDTTPPPDVPIAKSDANVSIDRDFPPAPVAE